MSGQSRFYCFYHFYIVIGLFYWGGKKCRNDLVPLGIIVFIFQFDDSIESHDLYISRRRRELCLKTRAYVVKGVAAPVISVN